MEQEYKWIIDNESQVKNIVKSLLISNSIVDKNSINMKAIYYDDKKETIKKQHGALRKRKQNKKYVCCLKLEQQSDNDCKKRMEYELEERDIYKALKRFPSVGAPKQLCEKISKEALIELCVLQFKRIEYKLKIEEECVVELAFDNGLMIKNGKKQNFREIELEFKSGDERIFHKFAKNMEYNFNLRIQPLSKIARAMKL